MLGSIAHSPGPSWLRPHRSRATVRFPTVCGRPEHAEGESRPETVSRCQCSKSTAHVVLSSGSCEEDFEHVLFEVLFTNVLLVGGGGMGVVWPAGLIVLDGTHP